MKKSAALLLLLTVFSIASVAAEFSFDQRRNTKISTVYSIEEGYLQANRLQKNLSDKSQPQVSNKSAKLTRANVILDLNAKTVLLNREQPGGTTQLLSLDKETGELQELHNDVSMARLSPDSSRIVVTTFQKREVYILSDRGKELDRLGVHGGSAVFSPNGRYIAYVKLANNQRDLDPGNPNMISGIYIYDTESAEDKPLHSPGKQLYGIAGWTPDGSRIYYLGQTEVAPGNWRTEMRSVRSDGGDDRIEIDPLVSAAPPLNVRTLWFPQLRAAVSESDGSIWLYRFTPDFHVESASNIVKGDYLQGVEGGKGFAFRIIENGHPLWRVIDNLTLLKPSTDDHVTLEN